MRWPRSSSCEGWRLDPTSSRDPAHPPAGPWPPSSFSSCPVSSTPSSPACGSCARSPRSLTSPDADLADAWGRAPSRSARSCRALKRRGAGRAAALLQVLLVVVLRLVERRHRLDLGDDRPLPARLLLHLRARRRFSLLLVVEEDRRPVLVADVPALPVELRRVVLVPEDAQELVVGDLLGVVRD